MSISTWFEDIEGRDSRDLPEKRKQFQLLFAAARNREFDVVIVDAQDRFGGADAIQFAAFIHELRCFGVQLWSTSQGCLSAAADLSVLQSAIGALASTREQREKAHRSIMSRREKEKRGEWQGGVPPIGLDIVCFNVKGEGVWRLVYGKGREQRTQFRNGVVIADFNGKGNTPARNKGEHLELRPSIVQARVKLVREIFRLADEGVSPKDITYLLSDRRDDCAGGDAWYKQRVLQLLQNPAYIGFPSGNKRTTTRFVEDKKGPLVEVDRSSLSSLYVHAVEKDDWWIPNEHVFAPIVPPE